MTPSFDPGLTQQYNGALVRTINRDGSFNVSRRGFRRAAGNAYVYLIRTTWPRFLGMMVCLYLFVNGVFGAAYLLLGPGALRASNGDLGLSPLARAFFFSTQTLSTVGYGSIYPFGLAAHLVSALEVTLGVGGFALATSLMFARFSRPNAKLIFSRKMLVAPYRDQTSLQFRVANRRSNVMMEVEADVILMTVEHGADGTLRRSFVDLPLERRKIFFLALTWTVVHPIGPQSPLWGKTREDLERLQAEVLILIKGFDDSFSQVVHARYSYRWDEIDWSARFLPAFEASPAGHLVLDIGRIHDTAPA
ncbi:MAG TPA: ion channel [Bryobacteraceae bacterium]|nr:ion channel [Bryobacteraceae bacterium]